MTRFANQGGELNLPSEIISSTVVLDGISYYVLPHHKVLTFVRETEGYDVTDTPNQGRLQGECPNNHNITPATLISFPRHDTCASAIAKTIEDFLTIDDVYSAAFASLIVIQTPSAAARHDFSQHDDESMLVELRINDKIITTTAIYYEGDLPSGPYFVRDHVIHEAWRLYCDDLDAFEITVVPHENTNEAKLGRSRPPKLAEINKVLQVLNPYSFICKWDLEECCCSKSTLCKTFHPETISRSAS